MLKFYGDKCFGCQACQLACSAEKLGVFSPRLSLLKVSVRFSKTDRSVLGFVCNACGRCADVCPVEAIVMRCGPKIDSDLCTSCGLCAEECPQGIILQDEEGKARICDFCGGSPACAGWCPAEALRWEV